MELGAAGGAGGGGGGGRGGESRGGESFVRPLVRSFVRSLACSLSFRGLKKNVVSFLKTKNQTTAVVLIVSSGVQRPQGRMVYYTATM